MSDFQAIGAVSVTLQKLLKDKMEIPTGVTDFSVTITTPRAEENNQSEDARINLFLFNVSENEFLKNQDLPGVGHPAAYGHPPLSLNLHYLVTAYGSSATPANADFFDETIAHYLLGSAMQVLHRFSIITEKIKDGLGGIILEPPLRDEYERVKLTLDPISLEDLSKIWTGLTVPLHLSAAYSVNVVQIESKAPRVYPRPVGEPPDAGPRIQVVTFRTPTIEEVIVLRLLPVTPAEYQESISPYARIEDRLLLRGYNFSGENVRVFIGKTDVTPEVIERKDNRILLTIPDDPEIQPGVQAVRISLDFIVRPAPEPSAGIESNIAAFMLVPKIDTVNVNTAATPRTLEINGSRLFREKTDCMTLVGDEVIRSEQYTTQTPAQIQMDLPDSLDPGDYAVRVRVNGAESIENFTINLP